MQRWIAQMAGVILVSVWLATGAFAQVQIPAEERAEVEQRVEEMEAQFRRIRDQKISRCRGTWSLCTNRECKKIGVAETSRWQTCQDACDEEYERCMGIAYEIWPDGE